MSNSRQTEIVYTVERRVVAISRIKNRLTATIPTRAIRQKVKRRRFSSNRRRRVTLSTRWTLRKAHRGEKRTLGLKTWKILPGSGLGSFHRSARVTAWIPTRETRLCTPNADEIIELVAGPSARKRGIMAPVYRAFVTVYVDGASYLFLPPQPPANKDLLIDLERDTTVR